MHVSGHAAVYSAFHPSNEETLSPGAVDASMELWLDAEWAFSGLAAGASISEWKDRSNNNRHFSQYAAGDLPIVKVQKWNKKVAEKSLAAGHHLRMDTALEVSDAYTVALVYEIGTLENIFGADDTGGS